MEIMSYNFYAFVVISVASYWLFPAKTRWAILLAASVAFVWFANDKQVGACLLVLVMTLVAWAASILFSRFTTQRKKRIILILAITFEIGMLIHLKEFAFFYRMFGYYGNRFDAAYLTAPLGISYFTLSLTSYILDSYWGVKPEKNPLKILLFGVYFPLLTSGPIVRYDETGKELFKEHRWNYEAACFGLQRILWGFFKKIVISERLAVIVNTVYENPTTYRGLYVWIAVLCFTGQLYTDFSGCIDIVLGISELFGIKLPENFNLPFSARNLSEFWRKWHITLGLWLKNYIMYPLLKSGPFQRLGKWSKKNLGKHFGKNLPIWIALFITWFCIGFWHGGAWHYIIGVGLWFWFVVVLGEMLSPMFQKITAKLHLRTDTFSWHLFQSLRTLLFFSLGLGFFRANSLRDGIALYKAGLSAFNPWILVDRSLLNLGLTGSELNILVLSFIILGIVSVVRNYANCSIRELVAKQGVCFRWATWLGLFLLVLIFGHYGAGYNAADFIYRAF